MTASARQRTRSLEREAAFAEASCRSCNLAITNLQLLQWPAALSRSEEQDWEGGRNARATSRARARHLDVSPGGPLSRITGCRWLCRNRLAESETLTFR
jgi:hypothetical protein